MSKKQSTINTKTPHQNDDVASGPRGSAGHAIASAQLYIRNVKQ
jgi:hypothetical protein